jgi:hypothetical protein
MFSKQVMELQKMESVIVSSEQLQFENILLMK